VPVEPLALNVTVPDPHAKSPVAIGGVLVSMVTLTGVLSLSQPLEFLVTTKYVVVEVTFGEYVALEDNGVPPDALAYQR
jgi:hypothetical protein